VIRTVIAGSFFCPCISIYYHLTCGQIEPPSQVIRRCRTDRRFKEQRAWRLPTRAPHRRTATARRPSFRNHSGTRFVIGQNNYSG